MESTHTPTDKRTHLPHGADLDLDYMTPAWDAAPSGGRVLSNEATLKTENGTRDLDGRVPAHGIAVPEKASPFAHAVVRDANGNVIAFGTARNWTVLDPEAFVAMQREAEAGKKSNGSR